MGGCNVASHAVWNISPPQNERHAAVSLAFAALATVAIAHLGAGVLEHCCARCRLWRLWRRSMGGMATLQGTVREPRWPRDRRQRAAADHHLGRPILWLVVSAGGQ